MSAETGLAFIARNSTAGLNLTMAEIGKTYAPVKYNVGLYTSICSPLCRILAGNILGEDNPNTYRFDDNIIPAPMFGAYSE